MDRMRNGELSGRCLIRCMIDGVSIVERKEVYKMKAWIKEKDL